MAGTLTAEVDINETVTAEIEIDDLDDGELLECVAEARKRGLAIGSAGNTPSRRERLTKVYEDLVGGRTSKALANFEAALFDPENDAGLFEAWQALREGKWSAAVCHLDREVFGPTSLPKKPQFPVLPVVKAPA